MMEKDWKNWFTRQKMISAIKRHVEHLLAGQNTHQIRFERIFICSNFQTRDKENIQSQLLIGIDYLRSIHAKL